MKKITPNLSKPVLVILISLCSINFYAFEATPQNLCFKENKGQVSDQNFNARPDILFSGNTGNMMFYLKNNGISYQYNKVNRWETVQRNNRIEKSEHTIPSEITIYRIDINWLNTNNQALVQKGETLPDHENYYLTSCPNGALNVRSYKDVLYKNIYAGIDLKWYEKNGDLKYDYNISANADYKNIQFIYEGAEKIVVNAEGELIIKTPFGIIKEQKPVVIQKNKLLKASWVVKNKTVSFDIKGVDPSAPFVIDPMVRLWATYYGGSWSDDAYYTYADASGNVYMSGGTLSTSNIATIGAHQTVFGGGLSSNFDAYIVKFSSGGIRQWATYYGGTGNDYAAESIADALGNVYLTGATTTSNTSVITTPGAHQTSYSSISSNQGDAFLVMFNAHGIRVWGTYYGGDSPDFGYGVSLDNANNVYMVGGSYSSNNISTLGCHQPTKVGTMDPFLVKFNSLGVRQWGTYYGGNATINETAFDCVTTPSGDTYISGVTGSSNGVSTPGSHQSVFGGAASTADAFFSKFDSNGVLQWGTYYGGTGDDVGYSMGLDPSGNIYCSGLTSTGSGTVIATPGSHQSTYGGGTDGFLVKFDPAGNRLWGTYYGGSGGDYGYSATVDGLGNVYLVGATTSSGLNSNSIATPCAYQSTHAGGNTDAFLVKFTNSGARIWGTYYGSIYSDTGTNCTTDAAGNIYICGITLANSGTVIASTNGYQPVAAGLDEGFLVKLDGCISGNALDLTPTSNLLVCSGTSGTLSATCGNWYNTPTSTVVIGTGGTFTTAPLFSDTTFYIEDFSCGFISSTRTAVHLTLTPLPTLTLTNSNSTACVGEVMIFTATGASNYTWTAPNVSVTTSTVQVFAFLNTTYSVTGINNFGCKSNATILVTPNSCLGIKNNKSETSTLQLYPNPNDGSFTVQSTKEQHLLLTNDLGQPIKTILLSFGNNFRYTLSDLPNGVYFLYDKNANEDPTRKIIVLH